MNYRKYSTEYNDDLLYKKMGEKFLSEKRNAAIKKGLVGGLIALPGTRYLFNKLNQKSILEEMRRREDAHPKIFPRIFRNTNNSGDPVKNIFIRYPSDYAEFFWNSPVLGKLATLSVLAGGATMASGIHDYLQYKKMADGKSSDTSGGSMLTRKTSGLKLDSRTKKILKNIADLNPFRISDTFKKDVSKAGALLGGLTGGVSGVVGYTTDRLMGEGPEEGNSFLKRLGKSTLVGTAIGAGVASLGSNAAVKLLRNIANVGGAVGLAGGAIMGVQAIKDLQKKREVEKSLSNINKEHFTIPFSKKSAISGIVKHMSRKFPALNPFNISDATSKKAFIDAFKKGLPIAGVMFGGIAGGASGVARYAIDRLRGEGPEEGNTFLKRLGKSVLAGGAIGAGVASLGGNVAVRRSLKNFGDTPLRPKGYRLGSAILNQYPNILSATALSSSAGALVGVPTLEKYLKERSRKATGENI